MEAGVVNSSSHYARVGSIYTSRASVPGTRFHAWSLRRDVASHCTIAQARGPGPFQKTHGEDFTLGLFPALRRDVASHCTRAQAQDPGPFQNTQDGDPHYHASSSSLSSSTPNSSSPSSSSSCLTIDRDIPPGEIIEFPGTILVKGDVDSGSAIHASGDIIVLGQLEGKAHAGRNGNIHAVIFAWKLKSNALSIAGHDAGPSSFNGGYLCKVAALLDNKVSIFYACSENFKSLPSKHDHNQSSARTSIGGLKSWFAIDVRSMRKASKVAAFTGAYIFVVGIALLLFPESLFGLLFDVKSSVRDWIRVGAVLAVVFGIYYIGTAWGDAKGCNGANSFYISTIVGRLFIFLSFWWLVVNGAGGLPLFAVGTVNLLGALTMLNALRKEKRSA